ncbi:nitroreductase family protein, partial [Pseudomonas sp. PS02302]|uniref:nitroreductase family protein n=1 Tax=Pseudomonas sp. PS02302 TaxID=2991428 RepID=UPI00249A86DB
MSNAFIDTIKRRRSQYALGKNLPLAQDQVTALIQEAVKLSPSAFNSQSSRAVILFGAESDKFWGFVMQALRQIVPADAFAATEGKINSFAAGAGTVLFYEDRHVVAGLQDKYPAYADNFPIWSEQASGIAQFSVWTALANAGIGASLQHYNPLPDALAAAEWKLPETWHRRAPLPVGCHAGGVPG